MSAPLYCEVLSRGQTMRGFLHRPEDFSPAKKYPAVLLLHGLTGTHIEPHRFFVNAARHLAKQNIIAGRFDFLGNGDSDGEFIEVSPDTEIEDALQLIEWLQAQPGVDATRIGLVGLSMGGLVAVGAAARCQTIKTLCLWAATAHMYERMREQATPRQILQLKLRGWLDLGGNKTGRAFYNSAAQQRPLEAAKQFRGKVLIMHGEADTIVPVAEAHEYAAAFSHCTPALHILRRADHTFNRVKWERKVIETTAKWLKDNL